MAEGRVGDYNLAWEILQVGQARENLESERIQKDAEKIKGHNQNIRLLNQLSTELIGYSETKDSQELNEKITSLFQQLRERGLEVYSGKPKVSREELAQIKRQIGNFTPQEQAESQNTYVVDLQSKITTINTLQSTLTHIITLQRNMVSKILDRSIAR